MHCVILNVSASMYEQQTTPSTPYSSIEVLGVGQQRLLDL
jgi:hypothetical protein